MAAFATRKEDHYETQLFEFSPKAFFDEVKGIILERLCEGIDLLEEQLKKVPESILSREELDQGITRLRQQTDSNFNKTIHKLEGLAIDTLLKIPPHILLPSDVEQATQVSIADVALLQTEIDNLHTQLKNEKYMQARYQEELQEISKVLEQQQKLRNSVLSCPQIKCAEDLKQNLLFIQANEGDIKLANDKAKEVFSSISQIRIPGPTELLSKGIIE
ncbi:protein MIS12 homolog [Macrobrachium nipponense]|uniref:protein MIS12 homolog n=1 Tax=Macrobrachium nipponense TaxID=159736 RepID=UPI0030C81008